MKEQFVPYKLALKLRELGFDEECFAYYESNGILSYINFVTSDLFIYDTQCLSPLWQQAFEWFVERYDLSGEIYNLTYKWYFDTRDIKNNKDIRCYKPIEYDTYEEARQACLEKLIDLVS